MSDTTNETNPVLIGKHHDITPFASTNETRFAICGIHYNANEKRLEATDGNMAIRVPVCDQASEFPPVKAGDNTLSDCILPIGAFKRALSNAKDAAKCAAKLPICSYARLSANGDNKATMTTTDMDVEQAVSAKRVDAIYPNLDQVWPTEPPTLTIALGADLLKRIATYASTHGLPTRDSEDVAIKLEFTTNLAGVRFSFSLDDALGEHPKAEGVLMPMRIS